MSAPQQITIEQAISKAKKAAKAGNFALATELYNTILQRHRTQSPKRDCVNFKNNSTADPTDRLSQLILHQNN